VESLIPSLFPAPSFSGQSADSQGKRCMQLLSDTFALDWDDFGLDGAATPDVP